MARFLNLVFKKICHIVKSFVNNFRKNSFCDEAKDFMMFVTYKDEDSFKMFSCIADMLSVTLADALELFGEYFYHYAKKRGFAEMLHRIGRDMESFLSNLDFHHFFISSFVYGSIKSPSFRCEKQSENQLLLYYHSKRKGLYPLVIGLARECGRQIFNIESEFKILSISEEQINEGSFFYTRYNVIFQINLQTSLESQSNLKLPPIQSNCNGTIFEKEPDQATIGLSGEDVTEIHPFHIVFDHQLTIKGLGRYLARAFPHIKPGHLLSDHLEIIHPHIGMDWASISQFVHSNFVLWVKSNNKNNSFELKGQIYLLNDQNHMFFCGSPKVSTLDELSKFQLYLSDLPLHDVTRELTLLNQQRMAEVELSKELENTTSELKKVSLALEKEKKKVDNLLLEMLPKEVAESLKQGKKVEACSYDMVSILFSDIVTFTVISSKSHPMQIVDMLNELFTKFDLLCKHFDVYKVETIGDAYMIAAGLPIPSDDHAVKLAESAFNMICIANTVMSPLDGQPIQIRVGLHSGPVMTGVVGRMQPRYCLFGDTVNVASRMESHGRAGRIHLSQTTKKLLKDKGYSNVESRGSIKIKGKGKMNTYFLVTTEMEARLSFIEEGADYCKSRLSTFKDSDLIPRQNSGTITSKSCSIL